ncbi:hypothetical protein K461DRAFT_273219 [Myriangium duriaei CBS 260.36]|uniref:Ubiquitin 3 binding protein But2 C-terminal domain-containing protein n=1 Tax=Myriangium duriaei CBS 260.36 TaxID=1168546 RepID=A0A9P4MJF5_9PEZI|nr:hypothetical protein K461DRAFT_273219 [Myriangium duriaei CBS 260.36]
MRFSTISHTAALLLLAGTSLASPLSIPSTPAAILASPSPSSHSPFAPIVQTVTSTVQARSSPSSSIAPGSNKLKAPKAQARPSVNLSFDINGTIKPSTTSTATRTTTTPNFVYPTDTKFYHLKVGKTSGNASNATMGGTVVNKQLFVNTTASAWESFYLDGHYLALKTPSGPLYAQLPNTFPSLPQYGYDTENVVFGPAKSGNSLICTKASSGLLTCDAPYDLFGLPDGYTAPGKVVMYWLPRPGPLASPSPTYAYAYLVTA